MENTDYNTLEDLKNKYEGKQMIAKRLDMLGFKKKIIINSLVIINDNGKEAINFDYSWRTNKSEDIPMPLNIITIEELVNNYQFI